MVVDTSFPLHENKTPIKIAYSIPSAFVRTDRKKTGLSRRFFCKYQQKRRTLKTFISYAENAYWKCFFVWSLLLIILRENRI